MFSIIETGGKQYAVAVGDKVKIEKVKGEVGDSVVFDIVLLTASSEDSAKIGTPHVAGAKVTGEIVTQGKAPKVISLRYKAKKRVRTKRGHRQPFTEVTITKIA
ncbi:50S ribosomal protein L21 [Candidatus Azambacteria bacterium RBG_16_47_10]|uniref:Large ribosomal subunit protein bL21 n=1 Tax=Candidatus Azambacteria bacterium RBG_16_47_10 TaxID=1797292 RepID=A0A1F5B180_9BACT|nr:MAG: 50S ribosomal protein L21 [Candidatus Azambacteria bacterium RBG_16_47_10]